MASPFASFAAAAAILLTSQSSPKDAAARFTGGSITMDELDRFMVVRFGKEQAGQEALDFVIRDRVLELEAARRGARVKSDELREALVKIEAEIVARSQRTLDDELAQKGMDRATFEAIYRKQLLCEQLVRADLGLGPGDAVKREQQELWLSEKVKASGVVKENLPPGVVATVGASKITEEDLGLTLRLKASKSEVREALRALAALMLIEARGRDLGLEIGLDDVNAAIERRRERFASDPRMAGVSFEQFLNARGTTLDDLRRDRGVKAEALLAKIGDRIFPDGEVDARYAANRARYDGLYGEARRVSWILLHATEDTNQIIRRTYDEAMTELRVLAGRATSAAEFARLATLHSTDNPSRVRGGDLGWIHRFEPGHEEAVRAAVFAEGAATEKALGPVKTSQGAALLWIAAVKPAPEAAMLRARVRSDLVAEFYRKLVQDAKITTYLDPKPAESRPTDDKDPNVK